VDATELPAATAPRSADAVAQLGAVPATVAGLAALDAVATVAVTNDPVSAATASEAAPTLRRTRARDISGDILRGSFPNCGPDDRQ
jgi:hypothetical protein